MSKQALPDFYFNGTVAGKYDVDGKGQVIRIILENTFTLSSQKFELSTSELLGISGFRVWQEMYWNCGIRFELEDDLALQLCFDGGNARWPFWQEVLIPQIRTLAGALIFVNPTFPQAFRTIRATIASYSIPVYSEATDRIGLPFIVVAINDPVYGHSENLDEFRTLLGLTEEIPLVPWTVGNKESTKLVLLTLLEQIVNTIDAPEQTETTV